MARVIATPFAASRLLMVTAALEAGVAMPPDFPLPLDGILASSARRRRLGDRYGRVEDHHADPLGLARLRRADGPISGAGLVDHFGKQWVWAASCAIPLDHHGEETHWWHRRFDEQAADARAEMPPNVFAGFGRYMARRMPLRVTTCAALRWWAVGDQEMVSDLLATVFALGKKTAQGEGAVLRWQVEDAGPPDDQRCRWGDDGLIARPIPVRAHAALGLSDDVDVIAHQIRPPYWRARQMEQEGGGFHRESATVIAPWISKSTMDAIA